MTVRLTRREALGGLAATGLLISCDAAEAAPPSTAAALAALERRSHGRLGVCILDTASGRSAGYRARERFGMCSTFKLPLAALVLAEIDAGRLPGDRAIAYGQADLAPNSPVTTAHVNAGSMSVLALAKAAQQTSDNTAANLLISLLGDPPGVTRKLRLLGDAVSRLDRVEPDLNRVLPGEVRDTTTPLGMATGARGYLAGARLKQGSRTMLIDWMTETKTGSRRLRAGLPESWRSGDKTGTATGSPVNMVNKYNDVAIAWPPGRAPIIIAAYFDARERSDDVRPEDEAILAEVGRIAARSVA